MPDTSSKIKSEEHAIQKLVPEVARPATTYMHSSSFKMALLFTILLGIATIILGYFIYQFEQLQVLSGVVILFMFVVIFVSFAVSGFVVSRINRIAATAQNIIDTGDLSQRLPIDSNWDDLSSLAKTLNRFLDRNEELMQGIRTVSDNIAHDLRTPLTRLRNKLEGLDADDAEALVAEADQILDTFRALLRISNIETGKRHSAFQEVDLHVLLQDVIELYEPLIDEKQITFHADIVDCTVNGDRDLIFQTFANILDNAVKYTPEGGKIDITLSNDAVLTVCDTGPGIPQQVHEKVFERFYRHDPSRSTAGTGLGLSLVKAVVDLHGGQIEMLGNNPGLCIQIILTPLLSHR